MTTAETGDTASVIVETSLDAPTEKVWRTLSIPELAAVWLGASPISPANSDETGDTSFEIIRAEPFNRITYRWLATDAGQTVESRVTVEIWREGAGSTRFRLTHSAPDRLPMAANTNMAIVLAA